MVFYSNAVLNSNTIAYNATDGRGGGVYVVGDVTLNGNTIFDNTADWYGGGVCLGGWGNALLTSNVVVNNQTRGNGSGIYAVGPADLFHTTIAGNTGGDGSGVYVSTENSAELFWAI